MQIGDDFKTLDGMWMAEAKGRKAGMPVGAGNLKSLCPCVELLFGGGSNQMRRTAAAIDPATLGLLETALGGDAVEQVQGGMDPQLLEWTRLPSVGPGYVDQNQWAAFCMRFDKSARQAGCSFDQAKTLAAAMRELTSNVHDHSGAPGTTLVAYQAGPDCFAFSVADAGMGVLASLKMNAAYSGLRDPEDALRALLEGASRHGAGHGSGYQEVFRVLDRCAGFVRCRSGEAVLSWRTGAQPLIVQRPSLSGLVVSVVAQK